MDEDDQLLYGDLDAAGQAAEIENLREKLTSSEKQVQVLSVELQETQAQVQILLEEKKVLEKNIVTVYNTAAHEISRKDKEIADVKAKLISAELKLKHDL
mmetsp:Transcript_24570/g.24810  ORF Transcript_24570/g.24810 Transcript_24570/m.24810 type:complete len:100 (+) Transcript_24570:103-402(+)|eukprot:CAMPEP_0182422594 /NCGR_PEP_ID=MMETSP1167-20130531/8315_1 /TAXON_ID=2988 /ORGANISM="Mallomonas Sp, Strain CCMP3275" /LENGTH=99 /DNA_ID=CAMNT_0024600771 /DNA_START=71 /DNA_END=370 /DNA_ORIENTATION=-